MYDSLELHFIMEVHILTLSSFMYISLHMFDNSCNRYLQWKTGIFYDFISFFFSLGGKITGSSHYFIIKSGRLQAKSPANAGFSIFFYSSSALKFI